MIIGLSGRNGAGKGEVLAYLQSRSFYAHSLSDVIREELRRQGVDETRERMIEAGNAIRGKRGPGGLADILAGQLLPDRRNSGARPRAPPGGGGGAARAGEPLPALVGGRRGERAPGTHTRARAR